MSTTSRVGELHRAARPQVCGRVRSVVGLALQVDGVDAAIGDAVRVDRAGAPLVAEVVAVDGSTLTCLPLADSTGIKAGAPVVALSGPLTVPVGRALLGRVLDGLGRPLDGRPLPAGLRRVPVSGTPPHPLRRQRVTRQLTLGVRALDAFVPCGTGQRMGIFAGSGVGKSSLMSMVARGTSADVTVLALVGERGREVRNFLEDDLGPEGLARSVVVVSTSDEPALVRLRAALTATRIAEEFRDEGDDAVLLMDSLSRCATAQREVGLSAGEPPATRGYPPSVFALLPKLLERAGAGEVGSITGLYTVLVDGDDMNEPIGDAARSILDGHVVLSRRLATSGHFPSIDVLESVSRVAGAVTAPAHQAAAAALRGVLATHRDARDLVDIGAYVPGSNPALDRALVLQPDVDTFLRQGVDEVVPLADTQGALAWLAARA